MDIHLLSEETINRIAAGEVVERPVNVVKELVENAIDAGATAITCEIREGGKKMIRVTDNGCGIEKSQIKLAFLRHATSKIRDDKDLTRLVSLGFRGEALSSIAAVSQVEMITKTRGSLTGIRATNQLLNGFSEDTPVQLDLEEIGAPDGTSVVVRNLFYNVPVRAGFLKQPQTEAGYITDLIERQALSHPDISFHYRVDGREKLHTTGNGDLRELLYRIYGREISKKVLPVDVTEGKYSLKGFIGRPEISRTTRSFEIFFVNGRMLRSNTLSRALEAGYRTDLMQHRFPFAVLHLTLPPSEVDVNVHPAKMEVRFSETEAVYKFIDEKVHGTLHSNELIPEETLESGAEERQRKKQEMEAAQKELQSAPRYEPFEKARVADRKNGAKESVLTQDIPAAQQLTGFYEPAAKGPSRAQEPFRIELEDFVFEDKRMREADRHDREPAPKGAFVQVNLFENTDFSAKEEPKVLLEKNLPDFRIIGQVFETYWLIQYENKLLVIDQHAAHEKVNFERLMKRLENGKLKGTGSQMLAPASVVNLTGREEGAYLAHKDMELYGNDASELFTETLGEILEEKMTGTPQAVIAKIASMSCKAAVKGNTILSVKEAEALIEELLGLDNPYHCPHGRPTMIVFSQADMDKKFKRIVT